MVWNGNLSFWGCEPMETGTAVYVIAMCPTARKKVKAKEGVQCVEHIVNLSRVVPSPMNYETMGRLFGCYIRILAGWVVFSDVFRAYDRNAVPSRWVHS